MTFPDTQDSRASGDPLRELRTAHEIPQEAARVDPRQQPMQLSGPSRITRHFASEELSGQTQTVTDTLTPLSPHEFHQELQERPFKQPCRPRATAASHTQTTLCDLSAGEDAPTPGRGCVWTGRFWNKPLICEARVPDGTPPEYL